MNDVEIAVVWRFPGSWCPDRVRRARPVRAELAQAAQRDLDVADAELDIAVEILELALVPHLHGALLRFFSCPIRTPSGL